MLDTIRRRLAGWIAPRQRSISTDGSGDWSGAFALPTLAGPSINERTALGISAVWRAVNLYANTAASLPLQVVEMDDRGGRRPARSHPDYDLVHSRPNPTHTSYTFRQTLVAHAVTQGNGYAEIEWDRSERRAVALHLMDPRHTVPIVREDGTLWYGDERGGSELPAADVIHFRGLGWDGIKAYSPVTIARETLGTASAQQVYESGLYGNGAQAGGHIEIPGSMNSKQQQEYRDAWNAVHQGAQNSGKVGLLTGGAKWVQTVFSPADAQLILSRGFSIAEVARIFGVPPHMLGHMDGATFSNIEQQNIEFYQFSLMPWLESFEQELTIKLLGPMERRRFGIRHDVAALLMRGDMATRSAYNTSLFAMGAKSINEIRLGEGLNPIADPSGDKHWIPTNNLTAVEDLDGRPTRPAASTDPDDANPAGDPPALGAAA